VFSSSANSLVVSRAVTILSDMLIFTNNRRVRLARENILESLLINHPLDCPICDQAGDVICRTLLWFMEPIVRGSMNLIKKVL